MTPQTKSTKRIYYFSTIIIVAENSELLTFGLLRSSASRRSSALHTTVISTGQAHLYDALIVVVFTRKCVALAVIRVVPKEANEF